MLRLLKKGTTYIIFGILAIIALGGWGIFKYKSIVCKSAIKFYNDTFAIREIKIAGTNNLSSENILKASGLKLSQNLFELSVNRVRQNLEQMSWVKSAVVRRTIPSKIEISIVERVPIAYWQNKDQLFLVDDDGVLLPTDIVKSFNSLPISTGDNAGKAIPQFLKIIRQFPKIEQQIIFCTFLGNRRWNIQISRGLLIKLPEENVSDALAILQRMANKDGYFSSDIAVIDLRVPGRVMISKRKVEGL